MMCVDTMQKQQQLCDEMLSSQPLTCTRRVVLAHLGPTCGTPPARARRAIEVRLEENQSGKSSVPLIFQAAQPQLLAGGHEVYRKTDLDHFVTFNEISAT